MENKIIERQNYMLKAFRETFAPAFDCILNVIADGREKYKKDDWETRSINHHLEHIKAHINNFDKKRDISNLEDLTHTATRCIMLSQAILNKHKNDNNKPRP
jgi:hypothetical protein